ncbi:hypothetical protein B0A50_00039 [Salinomyces thailandicus]|uniref:Uncharacterized protein n=1 Tax=Salinomyces thailandicus TaxID=706561 RepID=A0A4V5N8I1_9PEZI|nr:hypothetical protein B0A50_00039 [Salinomyces thailandica]
MGPRIARSSTQNAAAKTTKNKSRKRNLDAYATASHQVSNSKRRSRESAPHRLGESLDDNPRQKRRKTEEHDASDDDASEDDSAPRRKLPTNRGRGLEEDGAVEEGSDSEGNQWTMGGLAEDDEDSDLDSDEAFGESDEEKFEGFTFRGSRSNQKKPMKIKQKVARENFDGDIDLNEAEAEEDESEEDDDFGGEGVDLATMLDDQDDEMLGGKDTTGQDMGEESASDGESDSEAESEDDEDEQDNEERMARLRDRLEALDNKSAAALPAPADAGTLSIDDLLADLDPAAKKQYATALKTKKKSQAPKTLTAPLPKRQQDKLNREIASQRAKEQLDRWRDTVMHNRRAEFLSFPLQDPNRSEPIGKEKFDTQGLPQNELEASIRQIMEESGMASKSAQQDEGGELGEGEDGIMKAEELGTNHLPVEEVTRRRQELRRARELLFREEIKAKRISKIKSKAYRRVHRRERERNAEKERALLDPDGTGLHMNEDEREHMNRKRAEERMSTKHRDSKWAKSLKATNRTVWDEGARDSIHDQARRQEELRRRIAGEDVDGDDAVSSSGSEESDEGQSADAQTLSQLKKLKEDGKDSMQKGISGMKFMRAAEERQKARNDEDVERLRKEFAVNDEDEVGESEKEDEGLGRAIFGPRAKEVPVVQKKAKRSELEEGHLSGDEDEEAESSMPPEQAVQQQSKSILRKGTHSTNDARGSVAKAGVADRRDPAAKQKQQEQKNATTASWLDDDDMPKKGKKDRRREAQMLGSGDVIVTNESSAQQTESSRQTPKGKKTTKEPTSAAAPAENTDDDHAEQEGASDAESNTNPILSKDQQKAAFHRRAFAGDDVQAAFKAEKEADMASEDEKEISTHLPGWGSWTGSGLSKSIRKANKRAQHNPLFKHKLPGGIAPEKRKDAKLPNVVISERREKKGGKYQAPMLPHGFETREQYERSLRVPVGPEWSTKEVFQRGTRPKVVVKPGTVVEPIERPAV